MINSFKEILEQYNLKTYLDPLVEHWTKTPPTLGHGPLHAFRVAVNGYELARLNDYNAPEEVFVIGLFHDIHRPAEGKDGEEDQTLGAKFSEKILKENGSEKDLIDKVLYCINSHDDWRDEESPKKYALYFSFADKSTHKPVIYEYAYASNKTLASNGKPIRYTSHLAIYAAFTKYQLRAWEIFQKFDIKGKERAIDAYVDGYREVGLNYQEDPKGENFERYLEKTAIEYQKEEWKFLSELSYTAEIITQIQKAY